MRSLVLTMTDFHYGKHTGSYNIERAIDTLWAIIPQLEPHLKGVDHLLIAKLGDMVDADEIYPSQSYHTDEAASYARKQVSQLTGVAKSWLSTLAQTVPWIEVHGVLGNHGRGGRFTHEANNWDLQYYDSLRWACDSLDNVGVDFSEKFYGIMSVQDLKFLLYHGYSIKMYNRIPYYGMEDRIKGWSKVLDFDHALFGHFHTFGLSSWNGIQTFLSGTSVTDDEWALEQFGKLGENKWWALMVEDNEILYHIPIDVGGLPDDLQAAG